MAKLWNYTTSMTMNAKSLSRLLLLFGLISLGFAREEVRAQTDFKLINKIDLRATALATDMLGNAYIVNQMGVERYDTLGNLTGRFGENRYGRLHSVDPTSPFNLLLFYKDFATVLTLDGRMNVRDYYKLSTLGIDSPTAVCLSEDNYIWLFDADDSKLKKVSNKYEVVLESVNLEELLGSPISPTFMIEREGILYVNDPDLGVLLFDRFGTYYNSVLSLGLNEFQLVNGRLAFVRDGQLNVYDMKLGADGLRQAPLPIDGRIIDAELRGKRLYVLSKESLFFYGR